MTTITSKEAMVAKLHELKEFMAMAEDLKNEIEAMKDEAKDYMKDHDLTEFLCDDGLKATYGEVISSRFDSTAFKKSEWAELYKEYSKKTSAMRFTLN